MATGHKQMFAIKGSNWNGKKKMEVEAIKIVL